MTAAVDWRANVRRVYLWKSLASMHFFAGVLIPFFTQWGGISFQQVLWLQTWFMLTIVALEVPTGAFADRFGRRRSLFCASGFVIAAVSYYVTHHGFGHFLVAETLWACGAAFSSGADQALVYDSLKAAGRATESKTALTRLSSAEILAIAVAAPIGSLVAARWGLAAPLALGLVPFTLALPVAWSLNEPPHEREERQGYWRTLTGGARYFLGHPVLRALAFDSVSVWCLSFMVIWLYQPRMKELGVPIFYFGFVAAAMTLTQAAVLGGVERLERLCGGPRRFLFVSATVPGLAFLALSAVSTRWLAPPLFMLVSGLGLSRMSVLDNYMHKHVDSARRATVMSAVGMARQLTMASIYPLIGWAAQRSLTWTFAGLGAAVLACAWASSVEEAHLLD
ncbi:MAG: MFS transporter [Elusimicrobia bacterium]|nr:MFS transporter [Elusimicrobiota bacterium]